VEIAARHDAAPSQAALAWLLRHSPAMLPIPGTSSVSHLEENVAAATLELADEEMAALAAIKVLFDFFRVRLQTEG
jgi:aryl-alcohol dehydrogenase-like predicted oxidoreductase